jgi:hypothetical protein
VGRGSQQTCTGKGAAMIPPDCGALPRRTCLLSMVGLLLALSSLSLPPASEASPARYVYELCDSALPGGEIGAPLNSLTPNEPWSISQNCAALGGSFTVGLAAGIGTGGDADWVIPVSPPSGSKLESATVSASFCPTAGTTGYVVFQGWPGPTCTEETRTFQLPSWFSAFEVVLRCFENCPAGAQIHGHYMATVVADPVAPTVSEVGGTLLAGGIQRGHQSVSAKAGDVGGGLSAISVLVNGVTATSKPQPCAIAAAQDPSITGIVAATISPCPGVASASWSLDTGAYPFREGTNTVAVCASDFATLGDPNTTCSQAQEVEVDDSCPESSVGGGEVLSAAFSADHGETTTKGYGKGAEVSGTLATNSGDPVPGATLCVKQATLGVDPAPSPVATVQTDASGAYAYRLPPGPNRAVLIGYRHDSTQIGREVRFYSHARPSLTADPGKLRNGQWVHFTGTLPGPNRRGRVIVLQANVVGSKRWITFRKATSTKGGAFTAAYHFTQTGRPTVYRFRAIVPAQAGYPWAQGHSEVAVVSVRP